MGIWIESHAALATHHKLGRLRRSLGISKPQAIGHLHLLWWWGAQHHESGDLSDLGAEDIADAAEWEGDASKFYDALASAGFIDADGQLHDWQQYFGKLLDSKMKSRQRAALGRERQALREEYAGVRVLSRTVRADSEKYADVRGDLDLDLDLDPDLDLDQVKDIDQRCVDACNGVSNAAPIPIPIPEESKSKDVAPEGASKPAPTRRAKFVPPTESEAIEYGLSIGLDVNTCKRFVATGIRDGWTTGAKSKPMANWKGAMQVWKTYEDKAALEGKGKSDAQNRSLFDDILAVTTKGAATNAQR